MIDTSQADPKPSTINPKPDKVLVVGAGAYQVLLGTSRTTSRLPDRPPRGARRFRVSG